ncbi:MAG: DUF4386 domain-containing protein [Deltaproteobacteria bacterium]|nr:DUF4386 domain-containing protein [Deltaproteobacteria bacterium]
MLAPTRSLARLAGALYLVLIACGVGSEALVRGTLFVSGDVTATATNLLVHEDAFRLSILADVVMALSDIGLGVAMFVLLASVGPALALTAMAFRLAQAAVLGLNLAFLLAAVPLAQGLPGVQGGDALAALALEMHSVGYDLGLFFFAVNSVLTGWLFMRAGFPRILGLGLIASGLVYGIGSTLVVIAPELGGAFAVAYAVPLLAEFSVALWLLVRAPLPSVAASSAVGPARQSPPRLAVASVVLGGVALFALPASAQGTGRLLVQVDKPVHVVVDGSPLDGDAGTRTAIGHGLFGTHNVSIYSLGGRALWSGDVTIPAGHEVRCRWQEQAFDCYASEPIAREVIVVPRGERTTTSTTTTIGGAALGVGMTETHTGGSVSLEVGVAVPGVVVEETTTTTTTVTSSSGWVDEAPVGCVVPAKVKLVLRATDGEWADVLVDGKVVAELRTDSEATVHVSPGVHTVEVRTFLEDGSYAGGQLDTGCQDTVTLGLTKNRPVTAYDTHGWTAR